MSLYMCCFKQSKAEMLVANCDNGQGGEVQWQDDVSRWWLRGKLNWSVARIALSSFAQDDCDNNISIFSLTALKWKSWWSLRCWQEDHLQKLLFGNSKFIPSCYCFQVDLCRLILKWRNQVGQIENSENTFWAITFEWSVLRTWGQRLWTISVMLFSGIPHLPTFRHVPLVMYVTSRMSHNVTYATNVTPMTWHTWLLARDER